jgi:hypothetical protein
LASGEGFPFCPTIGREGVQDVATILVAAAIAVAVLVEGAPAAAMGWIWSEQC